MQWLDAVDTLRAHKCSGRIRKKARHLGDLRADPAGITSSPKGRGLSNHFYFLRIPAAEPPAQTG
jgi:hypothetical protein